MFDNATLASLQRSLGEYREAKRKTKTRLAEIEAEAEMLRSQLATIDAVIEQTEVALRKVLFPADYPGSQDNSQTDNRSGAYGVAPYSPSEIEIEAEVAGTVAAKLVENGRPVEYGEALFALTPR